MNDSLVEYASIEIYDSMRTVKIVRLEGLVEIIDRMKIDSLNEDYDVLYGEYDYRLLKKYIYK